MSKIADNVLQLIGDTPLVRLKRLPGPGMAAVLGKLESLNPGGSVKDRIALAMLQEAEARGALRPGDLIVEATGGNTGVALALVGAVKGYRVVLTMPESVSLEHRQLVMSYGAEVVVTPAAEGMAGAVRVADQMAARNRRSFRPRQFDNPANPEAHRRTTGPEILRATRRRVHAFVAGVGSGGTVTGVGQVLKREVPGVLVVGVEPASSPLLSGGKAGPHGIWGLGANFVPPVLDLKVLDEVIAVEDGDAYATAARLAREEGLLVGASAGANVFAALQVAGRLGPGRVVVTMLPDGGERHLAAMIGAETASATAGARGH